MVTTRSSAQTDSSNPSSSTGGSGTRKEKEQQRVDSDKEDSGVPTASEIMPDCIGLADQNPSRTEEEYVETPKKKKNKVRKSNKEQALLAKLPELPIDILTDICTHLAPLDLLHLSRLSKSFFALIDGPAFKSVWFKVRKSIELPELRAEGLSDLQYAALVFDHYCQVCGKDNVRLVDFFVRKRYCPSCKKRNLLPISEHVRKLKAHPFLYEVALSSLRGGTGANLSKTLYYHFPSLEPLNSTLDAMQSRIDEFRPDFYVSIHSKNHMALRRRYKRLVEEEEEEEGQGEEEFEEDERELKEFVTERRELRENVEKDAERLEAWVDQRERLRAG